jgi:hypothetical protein
MPCASNTSAIISKLKASTNANQRTTCATSYRTALSRRRKKKNSGDSKLNPAAHELGAIPALSANVESGRKILSFGEKKSSAEFDRQSNPMVSPVLVRGRSVNWMDSG